MNSLMQDFHYAVRQLRRNPGFAAIAFVTIALGIGVTTAMFSVVNAVLLRPLPFRQPDRLLAVGEYDNRMGIPKNDLGSLSYPDVTDIRSRNSSLADIAAYDWSQATLTGSGEPRHVNISHVNASMFSILGVKAFLGRTLNPDEDQPGHYSAVVSYKFWRADLNADKNVIGRNVNLNGRVYTIVGVMPSGFQFPISSDARDLWLTFAQLQEVDMPGDIPATEQRGNPG